MSASPQAPFLERLRRAAAATRDLLAHSEDARWEIFAKASSTRKIIKSWRLARQEIRTEETGVAVRLSSDGRAGFGAASGIESAASRLAVEGARAAVRPQVVDPIPPGRYLGRVSAPEPAAPPARGWASYVSDRLADSIRTESDCSLTPVRIGVREGKYAWILSTKEGFTATHEGAGCSISIELADAHAEGGSWREWLWVRDAESFDPDVEAVRIVNRVLLRGRTRPLRSGMHDILLHGEVAAHLLAALAPLFTASRDGEDPVQRLVDREGRLAAPCLTLVDDRVGEHGPLTSPCDGEGLPSRRITVLDEGVPRHRVASYRDAILSHEPARGGARRVSYKEPPASGFANLMATSDDGIPPAKLLSRTEWALYLVRLVAPVRIDVERNTYRLTASGLALRDGRAESWHPVIELRGGLGPMLRNIDALGTDIEWRETAIGYVGAPTLLIRSQPVFEGG